MLGHRKHLRQDSDICVSATTYLEFKSLIQSLNRQNLQPLGYTTLFQNNTFVFFSLCESEVRTVNFNAKQIILNNFYFILWIDEFS